MPCLEEVPPKRRSDLPYGVDTVAEEWMLDRRTEGPQPYAGSACEGLCLIALRGVDAVIGFEKPPRDQQKNNRCENERRLRFAAHARVAQEEDATRNCECQESGFTECPEQRE